MLINIVTLMAGLGILLIAGDLLVRGAVGLACRLGVPALLVSLTIIAFGTSAPELVVSIKAVIGGRNGIAIGNIVGSNIANILLVLGLPAIIYPIAMTTQGLRRHMFVMLLATLWFMVIANFYGVLAIKAGLVMLLAIGVYVTFIGIQVKKDCNTDLIDDVDDFANKRPLWRTLAYIGLGLVGLPIGASFMVDHGAQLAGRMGVRSEIIGLTIIAFGTSLPELATVIIASLRRQADIAVGNIIGSNIFNLLFVGGATGLAGTTYFSFESRSVDMPVMLGATLLLGLCVLTKTTLNRLIGMIFLALYLVYIGFIGYQSGII